MPPSSPLRQWSSGLCGCSEDPCSCCAVWCCIPFTTAQLCVRHIYKGTRPGVVFALVSLLLWLRVAANYLQMQVFPKFVACSPDDEAAGKTNDCTSEDYHAGECEPCDGYFKFESEDEAQIYTATSLVGGLLVWVMILVTCYVRTAVRKQDQISGECNCPLEDCCCAFWCLPCTQCQILRQCGLARGKYELCEPDGGPGRLGRAPASDNEWKMSPMV